MAVRADTSLAALLLANRLVDAGAAPLATKEFWGLVGEVGDPAALLGASAEELSSRLGEERGERVVRLLGASTQLAFELERLERSGIRVLSPFDDDYPAVLRERLGTAAPPILPVVCPPALLDGEGLGVVGSRSISPSAEEAARDAAGLAASLGRALVSGAARGTDIVAMSAAFEAGGAVVGILADPLDRKLREPDIRRAIGGDRLCLASPYKPDAGFSVASAMSRNKVIYALSRLTLVVATDLEKGGTWAGAVEALRRGYGRVAVWMGAGAGPGNAALVARGGIAVGSVEELRGALDAAPADAAPDEEPPDQLSLGL